MNIKDFVTSDNAAQFDSFRAGVFYYNVQSMKHPFYVYQFQVPVEDIGTATLFARDKSIFFMRWIRKSIENKTFIKI
jgi:hypothetical protein